MPSQERTPQERETLIFSNPEQAGQFTERVEERWQNEQQQGIHRRKDVVREEVAKEFEKHGQGVQNQNIKHPWEHTPAEHEETQHLVDVAFSKDLSAALRLAQKSEHYPRNLDLFHDTLTGEMYELMHATKLNQQPLGGWVIVAVVGMMIVIAVSILILNLF